MRYFVTIAGREVEVDLSGARARVDGAEVDAELVRAGATPVRRLVADGRSFAFVASRGDRRGRWRIVHRGVPWQVEVVDERSRAIREMVGEADAEEAGTVTAPMPGKVVRVEVEVGQDVRAGQGVVVVEAMKMENELAAPVDGVVTGVQVAAGDTVEKGAILIVLE